MKKRKFRAMTIREHCVDDGGVPCKWCEYSHGMYCDYPDFNQGHLGDRNKPYKTKDGKYILIEVE